MLDWEFDIFDLALDDTIISVLIPFMVTGSKRDIRDLVLEPVLDDVLPSLYCQSTSFDGVNMFSPSSSSQHYVSVLLLPYCTQTVHTGQNTSSTSYIHHYSPLEDFRV